MKTILFSIFAAAIAFVALVGCNSRQGVSQAEPMSVDSLMSVSDAFVDDTVTVTGVCSHICSHGGRKAFLQGADSALTLRCQATGDIVAFAPDCPGKVLTVRGIVREDRLDLEQVDAMEAQFLAADSARQAHENCDTERKAQGQADIDSYAARMADYRQRIEARNEAEGKPYLSFYYIDAISYTAAE